MYFPIFIVHSFDVGVRTQWDPPTIGLPTDGLFQNFQIMKKRGTLKLEFHIFFPIFILHSFDVGVRTQWNPPTIGLPNGRLFKIFQIIKKCGIL